MTIPSVTNSAAFLDDSGGTTESVTITISSASSRVLIAFPGFFDNAQTADITSVVFDPGGGDEAAFSHEVTATNDYSALRVLSAAYYLILDDGVSSGDYAVTFTVDESTIRLGLAVWEVADADTTDPLGASGVATGNDDVGSVSVTTTATNSLVGAGLAFQAEATFTAGSGDTEETDINDDAVQMSLWSGYTLAASITSYTVSATSSLTPTTDEYAMVGVEIFEAAEIENEKLPDRIKIIRSNQIPIHQLQL